MDKAMQQVAAMGNPNDPAVQYRQAFLKMMLAIEKRSESESVRHGKTCIDIAQENVPKNKYWIGQIIAVYAALANDQVGYRNFKKAITYASQAVEVAGQSKELITDEFIHRKFIAQAVMMRGSLYSADKDWTKAIEDFSCAIDHYLYTNDVILAMEATRMVGYCNIKYGNKDAACKALAEALEVAKQIPAHTIKYTTLPGVLELLLQFNNQKYISQQDVEGVAASIYGNDWMKEIMNWKNPHYEQVTDPIKVMNS
jgi:tetratricopeptide (TPR) repeat protein